MISIDLGTSNTCSAFDDGTAVRILEFADGRLTMPTVIAWDDDNRVICGAAALRYARKHPARAVQRFKRVMGCTAEQGLVIEPDTIADETGMAAYDTPGGVVSPQQLAEIIITAVLDAWELRLKVRPKSAVITVPTQASQAARLATQEAGRLAGLERVELLPESVAAGLKYGLGRDKFRVPCVVDIGAGTADVTINRVGGRNGALVYNAIGSSGDIRIGGANWDRALAAAAREDFEAAHPGADLGAIPSALTRLNDGAEDAKKLLSDVDAAQLRVPQIYTDAQYGLVSLDQTIELARFNDLMKPMREKLLAAVDRALEVARESDPKFHIGRIDELILVGGMSRVRVIRDDLEAKFGKKALNQENPETVVAAGAAIEGAFLDGRRSSVKVQDTLSQSVGLRRTNGAFLPLIPRGAEYPLTKTVLIANEADGQGSLAVNVRMGNDPAAIRNRRISYRQHEVNPAPVGKAIRRLTVSVDRSQIVSVEVEDAA